MVINFNHWGSKCSTEDQNSPVHLRVSKLTSDLHFWPNCPFIFLFSFFMMFFCRNRPQDLAVYEVKMVFSVCYYLNNLQKFSSMENHPHTLKIRLIIPVIDEIPPGLWRWACVNLKNMEIKRISPTYRWLTPTKYQHRISAFLYLIQIQISE